MSHGQYQGYQGIINRGHRDPFGSVEFLSMLCMHFYMCVWVLGLRLGAYDEHL